MAEKEKGKTDKTDRPVDRDRLLPKLFPSRSSDRIEASDGSQLYGPPVDVSRPLGAQGSVVVGRIPTLSKNIRGNQLPDTNGIC